MAKSPKNQKTGETDARQGGAAGWRARRPRRSPICSIRRSTKAPRASVRALGLQQPPDNSFDRRADFSAAHKARKSARKVRRRATERIRRLAGHRARPGVGARNWGSTAKRPRSLRGSAEAARIARGSDPKYRLPQAPICRPTMPAASRRRRRRHRSRSTVCCARAARNSPPAGAVDAAPPAAPGKIRRRQTLQHQIRLRAEGRPAAGDQRAGRGRQTQPTAHRCSWASPARARPSPWRR